MASKFGSLTLVQLQRELKNRNAKISGRKHELVERLDAYDRNANFGQPDVTGPDFQMTVPASADYRDLHEEKQFVQINMDNIQRYLKQFDKKLDISAQNLYGEKFLLFVRGAVDNDLFFVKSACRAEMKKSVTYSIDISFDRYGLVNEAQCECAAGMGPQAHCKHVNAVLCAMFDFSTKGTFNVEETCTQRLQTFHHAKRFKGSPLKARDLQIPAAHKGTLDDFDPRPKEFRNMPGYSDYFRNTCLNTPNISSTAIFQLFPAANAKAVAHDHDYLKYTPEDVFLKEINLSCVSSDIIRNIEIKTQTQNTSKAWYRERTIRITSSNFGRVCKATEKTDFRKLSYTLTRSIDLKVPAILHGQKYEPIAVGRYMREKKCVVKKCGLCVSKDYPYLAASPDGVIGSSLLVEVKCPFVAKDKEISNITVPYLKLHNERLSLDRNHNYYYQIQGQLLCTCLGECDLVVYTLRDMKVLRIVRDDAFITQMVSKLEKFYNDFHRHTILNKLYYQCDR